MGIGNPNWKGYLQACPNCGGTKKPICEFVDCWCSDWDEDDWYTNDSFDRFVLETWTGSALYVKYEHRSDDEDDEGAI